MIEYEVLTMDTAKQIIHHQMIYQSIHLHQRSSKYDIQRQKCY